MHTPDVQFWLVVISSDRGLPHVRIKQVFDVQERAIQSGIVTAHFVDSKHLVTALHILIVDLPYNTALPGSWISKHQYSGVMLIVTLDYFLQNRLPEVIDRLALAATTILLLIRRLRHPVRVCRHGCLCTEDGKQTKWLSELRSTYSDASYALYSTILQI